MYSAIWVYPWDLLDEGVDTAFGRIAEAGLNGVSLASAYHSVRALCPHNPRGAVYLGVGVVVYFRPDPAHFANSRIKPVESDLLAEGDSLSLACEAAPKHGLKVHAWTVLHHNTRLGTEYPECTIENAFGDRYPFALCPANPDVRAYTMGLVNSLAARTDLDTIELESLGYMGIDHSGHHAKAGVELDALHKFLLSICFCPHCREHMVANGVDAVRAVEVVKEEMQGYFAGRYRAADDDALGMLSTVLGSDQAEGILAARDEVVLTLLEEIYWLVQKPQCLSVMVSPNPLATGAPIAAALSQTREWTDRLLVQAFAREPGAVRDLVADVAIRRGSTPVYAGLQAVDPFVKCAEDLEIRVKSACEAGADAVQFYHYGIMPLHNLEWIRSSLAEA
jgi:hypothetical protein